MERGRRYIEFLSRHETFFFVCGMLAIAGAVAGGIWEFVTDAIRDARASSVSRGAAVQDLEEEPIEFNARPSPCGGCRSLSFEKEPANDKYKI